MGGPGPLSSVALYSWIQQDRRCTCNATFRRMRVTTVAVEKQEALHIMSVLASVIECAKRMRLIILTSVACLSLPYFSTLSHKRYDIRKKKIIEHEICFDFLYNFFLKRFYFLKNSARYYHKCA
jgi:hypothetical protein